MRPDGFSKIGAIFMVAMTIGGCAAERSPVASDGVDQPAETTSPASPTAETESPSQSVSYEVWFHQGEQLFPTYRTEATGPAVGRAAIESLFAGPTGNEARAEVQTQVPSGTRLLGLDIDDGLATVDVTREFESGGGSLSVRMRVAQLVYTLAQFPSVDGVVLQIEGEQKASISGEGIPTDRPLRPKDFEDLFPAITVAGPRIGESVGNPVLIQGTANVFEATVSIRIRDAAGAIIAETFTTATCGTGCRGDYEARVRYQVSETQEGVIEVFESSAEDGSVTKLVRIPVTLSP
ncbi:MAG: Gmad2 immunoglobulin-like domain-containing protein [Actinomycetota bacterium]